ncbi:MAG: NAD-binding protein [Acidimicrobiales bacterium]|nr:NAD-binding protein [Acidimicrobiales bacterium]
MKSLGLILGYLSGSSRRRNTRLVGILVVILIVLVAIYSAIFHVLMAREGREHSWATGVYWALTVMSTLGFGDITFESDAGRIFTLVVLVSGALFILVLLPFVFIQFLFMPWVAWRDANRAPRRVADDVRDHLVLVGDGPVIEAVIRRADHTGIPYVLVGSATPELLARHDDGYKVMVGDPDSPDTYRAAGVDRAALVAATHPDPTNTNIVFTVREISETVPIVATASTAEAVDVLALAGGDVVLQLGEILGRDMAARVFGRNGESKVVGVLGRLLVAEADADHPDLVGRALKDTTIRDRANVHVVGTWRRGIYESATPDLVIDRDDTLILAGTRDQLDAYDEAFATTERQSAPVIVVGGGRVGRAAARALGSAGFPYKVVEKLPGRVPTDGHGIVGDAADHDVLVEAGITDAIAVLLTTHDDDVNVYLAIYCRRLRPDLQIISRAVLERNVATLHRAGADAVLSYPTLGANRVWNALGSEDALVLTEGLEVFRCPVPHSLRARRLDESRVREETGCTVVAVAVADELTVNPPGDTVLPADGDLVLIADPVAREAFAKRYPTDVTERRVGRRRVRTA